MVFDPNPFAENKDPFSLRKEPLSLRQAARILDEELTEERNAVVRYLESSAVADEISACPNPYGPCPVGCLCRKSKFRTAIEAIKAGRHRESGAEMEHKP